MKNLFIIAVLVGLASCSFKNTLSQDPSTKFSRQEIDHLLSSPPIIKEDSSIPKAKAFFSGPVLTPLFSQEERLQKKVSLHIEDTMDLKEILIQLCKQAKLNLILDKDIEGSINYNASYLPIIEVISTICNMSQLRFKFENNLLRIEKDLPYLKTYSLNFLSLSRSVDNFVSINSNVFGKGEGTKAGANGSSSTVSSKGKMDFWEELETSLHNILEVGKGHNNEALETEIIEEKKISNLDKNKEGEDSKEGRNIRSQQKKKIIKKQRPSFAIHRQAGLVSVYATEKQHKNIETFLEHLKKKTSTQILIEAKLIEVTLKEEYKSGIDWQRIGRYGLGSYDGTIRTPFEGDLNASALLGSISQKAPIIISTPETAHTLNIGLRGPSLSAILSFIESFGTVRTLSSPRLTVLNNQTAVLKVAENYIYFNVTADRQFLNSDSVNYGTIISATSQPQSIPIGLVMTVHPSINEETQDVILTLRPTISRLLSTKEDPAVQLLNQTLTHPSQSLKSEFPVVAVREIESVLRLKSGSVAILGGLMIEGAETGTTGIPGTAEGPFSFFTSAKRRGRVITELVIFIRATILEDPIPDPADKRLYETFTTDPRPISILKGT